jgi:hypothetical protein
MSVLLGASYDTINRAISQLRIVPAFTINETEHFSDEQVQEIREALREIRPARKVRASA